MKNFFIHLFICAFFISCTNDKKPNIIWITIEDQSQYLLPFNGNTDVSLPNLEKIADETSYSKVSQVFRNKIILKRYKDKIFFPIPQKSNEYMKLCYGNSWRRPARSWNNSQSKRYHNIKNF